MLLTQRHITFFKIKLNFDYAVPLNDMTTAFSEMFYIFKPLYEVNGTTGKRFDSLQRKLI